MSKKTFVPHNINCDELTFGTMNDRRNAHFIIKTEGAVGENDIEFKTCNLKVNDGSFHCDSLKDLGGNEVLALSGSNHIIKDTAGDPIMTIGDSTIDFHSATVNNLTLGTSSLTTNSIASQNYTGETLEHELDTIATNITGKLAKDGQTANKILTTSSGGVIQFSSNSSLLSDITTNGTNIGTIGSLNTSASNLVGAVNELHTEINTNTSNISTLDGDVVKVATGQTITGTKVIETVTLGKTSGGQVQILAKGNGNANFGVQDTIMASNVPSSNLFANMVLTGESGSFPQISFQTPNTSECLFRMVSNGGDSQAECFDIKLDDTGTNSAQVNIGKRGYGGSDNLNILHLDLENGRVGVNKSSATEVLDVAGNIAVSGTVDGFDMALFDSRITEAQNGVNSNDSDITALNNNKLNLSGGTLTGALIGTTGQFTGTSVGTVFSGGSTPGGFNFQIDDAPLGATAETYCVNYNTTFSPNAYFVGTNTSTPMRLGTAGQTRLRLEAGGDVVVDSGKISCGNVSIEGVNEIECATTSLFINTSTRDTIFGYGGGQVGIGVGISSATYPLDVRNAVVVDYDIFNTASNNIQFEESSNTLTTGEDDFGYYISYDSFYYAGDDTSDSNAGAGGTSENFNTGGSRYTVKYLRTTHADYLAHHYGKIPVSIRSHGAVWGLNYYSSSDIRIKNNIGYVKDLPDAERDLMISFRAIQPSFYEYKDKYRSGGFTLGFIAQQVKEHYPTAIGDDSKEYIPDMMKRVDGVWEDTFFRTVDAGLEDDVNYKLFLGNWNCETFDKHHPKGELERYCKYENNGFQLDKKYDYVYVYGKEVDDFHTLEKQKLFTLNYCATQILDKEVGQLQIQNEELEAQNKSLLERVEVLEKKLHDEETKTAYFQMRIDNLYSHLNL